ncbi:MAG TPA: 3-dehydroquinate synthase [Chitinispirillaceae bacterium]|nr:3-dehydroquinate synthase [Chitinispirillaceae bacterium]
MRILEQKTEKKETKDPMEIAVNLGENSYTVSVKHGISADLPELLKGKFPESSFFLITNTTIASIYSGLLQNWKEKLGLQIYTIPDGEKYKTVDTWKEVLDFLLSSKIERSSVVLALGGGVVGDITGFAASSVLRGVKYVQIPTTLLAMVDSSVGGKTAVDHPRGKNLIGAFYQPSHVFVDTAFLDTLSDRDFRSGYAELFKYAFIGGREMFDFISINHESILSKSRSELLEGIRRSIEIKARVVEQDNCERSGLRALLNFGHTFAHSLERFYDFESVMHGEAVFWGILCACELGIVIGTVPSADVEIYRNLLSRMPLPELPSVPDIRKLYADMFSDKKVQSGKIRFVLPGEPGKSVLRSDITEKEIFPVLESIFLR